MLESKYPPITPSAWTSLSTGLKPAKHGVYDFWAYESQQRQQFPPKAQVVTHRKGGKAIWNILSEYGKHVLIINVPVTYPPEPVNGMMISGYMTPSDKVNFTYPTSLKEELYRAVPNYKIDLEKEDIQSVETSGKSDRLIDATLYMTERRIELTTHLLKEQPWDFCYVAFVGADRLQHPLWEDICALDARAIEYFQLLDHGLGLILDELGPDDCLFVVSDHGFQGADRSFEINEYLYSKKLLSLNTEKLQSRNRSKRNNQLKRTLGRMGLLTLARNARKGVKMSMGVKGAFDDVCEPIGGDFDWEKTLAYAPSHSSFPGGYVDIFLSNNLDEESLTELCDDLKRQTDPRTGTLLVDALYTTEVFGDGPYAPREPHLLLLPKDGITFRLSLGNEQFWDDTRMRYYDPSKRCGIHHKDGVLYAYGGTIKHGFQAPNAEVYDLVPTVLHAMDLPIPEELDGHVLHNLFVESESLEDKVVLQGIIGSDVVSRKLKGLNKSWK